MTILNRFSLFLVVFATLLSCSEDRFIQLSDSGFVHNDSIFYPLVLNYMVSGMSDEESGSFWPTPSADYFYDRDYISYSEEKYLDAFRADMRQIKRMGFNAVRFVRIGEIIIDGKAKKNLVFTFDPKSDTYVKHELTDVDAYEQYFSLIKKAITIAGEEGLKTILLLKASGDHKNLTKQYLERVGSYFNNDTNILAYDLFNEPLYFDSLQRSKQEVREISEMWYETLKKVDQNHLITIGLAGIREVFEWDPNILSVDFISFHPYEKYQAGRVRNEIYWYGQVVEKPWIIGETAIPADGDSVPYEEQYLFATKTLKQTIGCGGLGYSWWQYKDVFWNDFHSDYMGLVTKNPSSDKEGIEKEITTAAFKVNPAIYKDSCKCLDNYYNLTNENSFAIKGRLLDKSGNPIVNGVIMAWSEWWDKLRHSQTKPDGTFEINASFDFHHWSITASRHETKSGNVVFEHVDTSANFKPVYNLGDIVISKME